MHERQRQHQQPYPLKKFQETFAAEMLLRQKTAAVEHPWGGPTFLVAAASLTKGTTTLFLDVDGSRADAWT